MLCSHLSDILRRSNSLMSPLSYPAATHLSCLLYACPTKYLRSYQNIFHACFMHLSVKTWVRKSHCNQATIVTIELVTKSRKRHLKIVLSRGVNPRATNMVPKSIITHWKMVKTHLKNKEGVKICISISRYALGVQSSAYWLAKLKLRIDDVHLFVHLSTYCQSFPLHYNE